MSCEVYRPDHNGECLTCDEPLDAHSEDAIAAGALLVELQATAKRDRANEERRAEAEQQERRAGVKQRRAAYLVAYIPKWLLREAQGDPELFEALVAEMKRWRSPKDRGGS